MSVYSSKFYQGRYIQGVIAGHMSQKGKAGYIASFPIPEVIRGINAFYLGATSVNPDFDIDIVWVNTWLHRDLRTPFGGVKNSGLGREGGAWSLGFFSEPLNVCIKHD